MTNDNEDFDPLDSLLSEETNALPPVAADGGFMPTFPVMPEPIPTATKETMICLRDCKYYLELTTRFNAGNTKGTLGFEPKQLNRFCRAIPGTEIDLTDELVSECSDWEPISETELTRRTKLQKAWLKQNKKGASNGE